MNIIKSRKTTAYIFAFMGLFVSLLLSCSDKDANTAEERALAFAQNYFNLRYKQSLTLCTENAKKWIVFRATNITQEDVDVINAQTDTAECEIDDVELNDDENNCRREDDHQERPGVRLHRKARQHQGKDKEDA